jgi:hypothetical protein
VDAGHYNWPHYRIRGRRSNSRGNLDSLRCASASLRPEDRSDDWIAVAVDANGAEQTARAATPELAIAALVERIASQPR